MAKRDKKNSERLHKLQNLRRSGWLLDPEQKAELAALEREEKALKAKEK